MGLSSERRTQARMAERPAVRQHAQEVRAMNEADRLRQESARALRLSQLIEDEKASEALAAHAATLSERAEALAREKIRSVHSAPATPQQPAQQQQQVQPEEE